MLIEVKAKPSAYQRICRALIGLMRLLTIPIEMLIHFDVGERYFGFSGVLSLIVMIVWAAAAPAEDSGALFLLVIVFVLRVFVHRRLCIRLRERGGLPIHSRGEGRPLLGLLFKKDLEDGIKSSEPVLLLLVAPLIGMMNKPLGDYVMWSGLCLLGVTLVRANLAYNKSLDTIDAQIEEQAAVTEIRDFQQTLIEHRMMPDRMLPAPSREACSIAEENT